MSAYVFMRGHAVLSSFASTFRRLRFPAGGANWMKVLVHDGAQNGLSSTALVTHANPKPEFLKSLGGSGGW